jgi:hypothetical protein
MNIDIPNNVVVLKKAKIFSSLSSFLLIYGLIFLICVLNLGYKKMGDGTRTSGEVVGCYAIFSVLIILDIVFSLFLIKTLKKNKIMIKNFVFLLPIFNFIYV